MTMKLWLKKSILFLREVKQSSQKESMWPWAIWLIWFSIVPCTERSRAPFLARAHTQVVGPVLVCTFSMVIWTMYTQAQEEPASKH